MGALSIVDVVTSAHVVEHVHQRQHNLNTQTYRQSQTLSAVPEPHLTHIQWNVSNQECLGHLDLSCFLEYIFRMEVSFLWEVLIREVPRYSLLARSNPRPLKRGHSHYPGHSEKSQGMLHSTKHLCNEGTPFIRTL